MLKRIENKWFQIFIVLFLPFLAYLNILENNFVWDDNVFIKEWDIPRHFSNLLYFLNGSAPIGFEGVYRPVKIILLSLDLHLFGNLNALLFHFQGIILHLAITLLIFFIIKKLTKEPILALISALLFGLSPVHTEAVSWATASLDLFGILFVFIAYLLYLYSKRGRNKKLLISSLVFAGLAYFSNELTFPFFLLLAATDYFIFEREIKLNKQNLFYLWYFLPIPIYFLIRFVILHIASRQSFVFANYLPTMLVMAKTFVEYTKALFFPLDLNIMPTFSPGITGLHASSEALKSQTIFDPMVILGIFLIIGLLISIIYFRKKNPIISFSIAWIIISFIPFSNIFPLGIYYSERYLYLLSFGFYLALGSIFFNLLNSKFLGENGKKMILFVILLILLLYFARTMLRNNDWRNDISIWQKTLAKSPNNSEINNNLGVAYMQAGDYKLAAPLFEKAIMLDPSKPAYYQNLGIIYYQKGDDKSALSYWEKAHSLDTKNEFYAIKLIQYYYDNKDYNKVASLLKTTRFDSFRYLESFFKGELYLNSGNLTLAKEEFAKSIQLNGNYASSFNGLASVYIQEKNFAEAENVANKAVLMNPKLPDAYNSLALIYSSRGDFTQALSFVDKALELDPNYMQAQKTKENIQRYFQNNLLRFLQQH